MKTGFIGAGNMAEAIIRGLIRAKLSAPEEILISDISVERLEFLKKECGVITAKDNASLVASVDTVVIAVKPKDVDAALLDIKENSKAGTLIVSIAAAISTGYIEARTGGKTPVIRVMPNTPALVGSGMAALCAGKAAGKNEIAAAIKLLSAVGKVIEVKEEQMDIVTAVSGSGPAYVFLFLEGLIAAGVKFGLKPEEAETLAYNTVLGSAKLVLETGESPETLRKRVTSPGGTTMEAVAVFENRDFKKIIEAAVKACMDKSKKLTR